MQRREVLALLCSLTMRPLAARAQAKSVRPKIGFLHPRTVASNSPTIQDLKPAWEKLGYSEPETVLLRSAEGDPGRLPGLATELVERGAGVLIAVGPAALRAACQTKAPVVAIDLETDPVRSGLAASFARPGGNVTGLFLDQPSLAGKWLDLLLEAAPRIGRVALAWDPETVPDQLQAAQEAAASRGIPTLVLEVRGPGDYERQFGRIGNQPASGVIQLGSPGFSVSAKAFGPAAQRHGFPSMVHLRPYAADGALMGYGPAREGYWSRTVVLADRILRGEQPGEIPIERPSRFELAINLKTAKSLGLALPDSLLLQADEVIE